MKSPKILLDDQIKTAKKLKPRESWGEWHFWLAVRSALHAGDVAPLVRLLRLLGPDVLAKSGPQPKVGPETFVVIAQTLDNLAAMIDVGLLTFSQKRGPGRPSGSRLERTLQSAKAEYDELRKHGLPQSIEPDGTLKFSSVSREEALDIVVKNNNGYVDRHACGKNRHSRLICEVASLGRGRTKALSARLGCTTSGRAIAPKLFGMDFPR